MGSQAFRAAITADPQGRPYITVPFDPDQAWGAKADHPVGGTIDGRRVRGRLVAEGSGWVLPLGPRWARDQGYTAGDRVAVGDEGDGQQLGGRLAGRGVSHAASLARKVTLSLDITTISD